MFNVHRLDRLTSGLTIVAKNTETAKQLGKCINDRDDCHKVYLARVKGRFPLNAPTQKRYVKQKIEVKAKETGNDDNKSSPCIINGVWASDQEQHRKGDSATTFWVTGVNKKIEPNNDLQSVFDSRIDVAKLNKIGLLSSEEIEENEIIWIHLACPCDIVCHKNGICKAGQGKAAQTSFAVLNYDEKTDSTVVLAKPVTG